MYHLISSSGLILSNGKEDWSRMVFSKVEVLDLEIMWTLKPLLVFLRAEELDPEMMWTLELCLVFSRVKELDFEMMWILELLLQRNDL